MSITCLSRSPNTQQSTISTRPELPLCAAKRQRNDGEDYDVEAAVVNPGKRKRSRNSEVAKSNEDNDLDLDLGLNFAIAKLDNRLLADYVAKQTKHFFPNLSLVELEDRYIPGIIRRQLLRPAVVMCKMKAKEQFRLSLSWYHIMGKAENSAGHAKLPRALQSESRKKHASVFGITKSRKPTYSGNHICWSACCRHY